MGQATKQEQLEKALMGAYHDAKHVAQAHPELASAIASHPQDLALERLHPNLARVRSAFRAAILGAIKVPPSPMVPQKPKDPAQRRPRRMLPRR